MQVIMAANVIFNLMKEFVASARGSFGFKFHMGAVGLLSCLPVRNGNATCTAVSAASCPAPDTLPVLVNTNSRVRVCNRKSTYFMQPFHTKKL